MAHKSLQQFIDILDKEGELIRIKEFVNPELEITEITDRFSKLQNGGKALLFENTGSDFPLLINMLGSLKRIHLAFGVVNLEQNRLQKLKHCSNHLPAQNKVFSKNCKCFQS